LPPTFRGLAKAGILAQKFIRITAVAPCTNVSKKHFSRHIAKPMLPASVMLSAMFLVVVN